VTRKLKILFQNQFLAGGNEKRRFWSGMDLTCVCGNLDRNMKAHHIVEAVARGEK